MVAKGNVIFRIVFQFIDDLWVYDADDFGIKGQPLVFGVDLILEKMVDEAEGIGGRLNLIFSSIPFPGSEHCLTFVREETEGFIYCWEKRNLQGWFSPSLRNYFSDPPPQIYLQILPFAD